MDLKHGTMEPCCARRPYSSHGPSQAGRGLHPSPSHPAGWPPSKSRPFLKPPRPRVVVAAFPRLEASLGPITGLALTHGAPPPSAFLGFELRPVRAGGSGPGLVVGGGLPNPRPMSQHVILVD